MNIHSKSTGCDKDVSALLFYLYSSHELVHDKFEFLGPDATDCFKLLTAAPSFTLYSFIFLKWNFFDNSCLNEYELESMCLYYDYTYSFNFFFVREENVLTCSSFKRS